MESDSQEPAIQGACLNANLSLPKLFSRAYERETIHGCFILTGYYKGGHGHI